MKIAFVAQPFDLIPPIYNQSLAIWIHELSKKISQYHEVLVLARGFEGADDLSDSEKVTYHRVPTRLDDVVRKAAKGIDKTLGAIVGKDTLFFYKNYYFAPYYYLIYVIWSALILRNEQVDVITILNFSQFVPIVRMMVPRAKIILVMQCDWLIELERASIAKRLEKTDVIVGCSDYITNGIKKRFPEYSEKCKTIYNGSNVDVFTSHQNSDEHAAGLRKEYGLIKGKSILFVGRITPEKGLHTLVEAMKYVADKEPESVLLIVGGFSANPPSPLLFNGRELNEDPYEALKRSGYEAYLKELSQGANDQIKFVGEVTHYDLAAYYNASDIFVHPSSWNEPFGMILTEAMSCRRPVVSTKTGGIAEIVIDGETGLLVEPDNPKVLSEAILNLMAEPAKQSRMGEAGYARVRTNFSWEQTASEFAELLNEQQPRGY